MLIDIDTSDIFEEWYKDGINKTIEKASAIAQDEVTRLMDRRAELNEDDRLQTIASIQHRREFVILWGAFDAGFKYAMKRLGCPLTQNGS